MIIVNLVLSAAAVAVAGGMLIAAWFAQSWPWGSVRPTDAGNHRADGRGDHPPPDLLILRTRR